jgi:hypothetical protein
MCAGATASCRCLVRDGVSPKRRDGATTQTKARPQPGYYCACGGGTVDCFHKVKPTTVPCCCARGLTSESCLVNRVLSAGLCSGHKLNSTPDSVILSLVRPRPTNKLLIFHAAVVYQPATVEPIERLRAAVRGLPIDHFSLLGKPPYRDGILASHMRAESGTFFLHAVPWYRHADSSCSRSTVCAVSLLLREGLLRSFNMLYNMPPCRMHSVTCFLEPRVIEKAEKP